MSDVSTLLKKQSDWQKSLRNLSWPEKLRMAARLREAVLEFRRRKPSSSGGAGGGKGSDPHSGKPRS